MTSTLISYVISLVSEDDSEITPSLTSADETVETGFFAVLHYPELATSSELSSSYFW